jgi:hypothetical protein
MNSPKQLSQALTQTFPKQDSKITYKNSLLESFYTETMDDNAGSPPQDRSQNADNAEQPTQK